MKKLLRVGVVGAPGYAGEELVRILAKHPEVSLTYVSGRQEREEKIQDLFPYLKGRVDLDCGAFSIEEAIQKVDLIFLCLPHTASMEWVPQFLKAKKRVVDVSADYRLKSPALYEKFYKVPHQDAANLKQAVYGMPEIYREKIRSAKLIANPGCYPTSVILGLLPSLRGGLADLRGITIDAKSGVTGAGRKADKALIFSEVNESFKAYKPFDHQHVPEMNQVLSGVAGQAVHVAFVPHLLPINRGILSSIYVPLKKKMSAEELTQRYQKFYAKEPFVRVYDAGRLPELRHVALTNFCHLGIRVFEERNLALVVSAIDNLGKGAASQAVHNMNLMAGFSETAGLL